MKAVVGLMLVVPALGQYPSTYPYTSSDVVPVSLPTGTPNFKFDDTDPGGYTEFVNTCDFNQFEEELAAGNFVPSVDCSVFANYMATVMQISHTFKGVYNCSGRDVLEAGYLEEYAADVMGSQPCDPATCCSDYFGLYLWNDARQSTTEMWNGVGKAAMCDSLPEPVYCQSMIGFSNYCMQQYITVTERSAVLPCSNVFYMMYLSCDVWVSTGVAPKRFEPEPVEASFSPLEQFTTAAYVFGPDHICRPYSYYFPDFAVVDTDTSSTDTTSDEGEESAVASFMMLFVMFAVLLWM